MDLSFNKYCGFVFPALSGYVMYPCIAVDEFTVDNDYLFDFKELNDYLYYYSNAKVVRVEDVSRIRNSGIKFHSDGSRSLELYEGYYNPTIKDLTLQNSISDINFIFRHPADMENYNLAVSICSHQDDLQNYIFNDKAVTFQDVFGSRVNLSTHILITVYKNEVLVYSKAVDRTIKDFDYDDLILHCDNLTLNVLNDGNTYLNSVLKNIEYNGNSNLSSMLPIIDLYDLYFDAYNLLESDDDVSLMVGKIIDGLPININNSLKLKIFGQRNYLNNSEALIYNYFDNNELLDNNNNIVIGNMYAYKSSVLGTTNYYSFAGVYAGLVMLGEMITPIDYTTSLSIDYLLVDLTKNDCSRLLINNINCATILHDEFKITGNRVVSDNYSSFYELALYNRLLEHFNYLNETYGSVDSKSISKRSEFIRNQIFKIMNFYSDRVELISVDLRISENIGTFTITGKFFGVIHKFTLNVNTGVGLISTVIKSDISDIIIIPQAQIFLQDIDNLRNDLTADLTLDQDLDFNDDASYDHTDVVSSTSIGWQAKKLAWTTGDGWLPIEIYNEFEVFPYLGFFDGASFTISNLMINRPNTSNIGLFGSIGQGSTINNLGVMNSDIKGKSNIGILVGYSEYGIILNCFVTGSVDGLYLIGGLAGIVNHGQVIKCYSASVVSSTEVIDIGGLIGYVVNDTGGKASK